MSWVRVKDIPEDVKTPEPLTISVNKWSGVRINAGVYKAMGSPKWVELEFDEANGSLRFKPGSNIVTNEVINQVVKVPLLVRTAMSQYDKRVRTTQRWLVELRDDGWWYTVGPAK